mmetsp:Transcript_59922/g.128596  ORF Transcript_59922/g.128596 Transcript_59922/m.128596 type:complete len:422 (-) Transcript_59922:726-1991(-)
MRRHPRKESLEGRHALEAFDDLLCFLPPVGMLPQISAEDARDPPVRRVARVRLRVSARLPDRALVQMAPQLIANLAEVPLQLCTPGIRLLLVEGQIGLQARDEAWRVAFPSLLAVLLMHFTPPHETEHGLYTLETIASTAAQLGLHQRPQLRHQGFDDCAPSLTRFAGLLGRSTHVCFAPDQGGLAPAAQTGRVLRSRADSDESRTPRGDHRSDCDGSERADAADGGIIWVAHDDARVLPTLFLRTRHSDVFISWALDVEHGLHGLHSLGELVQLGIVDREREEVARAVATNEHGGRLVLSVDDHRDDLHHESDLRVLAGLELSQGAARRVLGEVRRQLLQALRLQIALLFHLAGEALHHLQDLLHLLRCARSPDLLRDLERTDGEIIILDVLGCHATVEIQVGVAFAHLLRYGLCLLIGD